MIAEFLNRDVVLRVIEDIKKLPTDVGDRRSQGTVSPEDARLVLEELTAAVARDRQTPTGPRSYPLPPAEGRRGGGADTQPPPIEDRAFISSDWVISLLQSALDALYQEPEYRRLIKKEAPGADRRGGKTTDPVTDLSLGFEQPRAAPPGRRIFDKFSITDLGWVRAKLAEGIRLFRKRHAFNDAPAKPATIPARARLVLVGDWGSGVPRARAVAKQMRKEVVAARKDGVATHVIHLGDVYYSGWDHEYQRRFLPYWPVQQAEAGTIGSWCLNGNHDMYSGGHAYFGTALKEPRFAPWHSNANGPSSFFSLVNANWKILGLDSAWDDGGLKDPQSDWLRDELRSSGNRKTLLLSHHQFVSAYESVAKDLIAKVSPILEVKPVTAWFWGHEHRCMHFSTNVEVAFGRCLGDGGVPVYQWHKAGDPVKAPGTYEHRACIKHGLEHWAKMGFAVLDLIGDRIEARYLDEDGVEHARETIA
ncbi:MAG TPA: metallophosphoesterase [Gemmatimonadaceae bacterium]|nr:metallophosphoesterase [Gemmatimonadaceae bacterium]